jgi:leucyl-tRNA---protein transferase
MDDISANFINDEFTRATVTPAELDRLLADGWRHFGAQFFRYNLAIHEEEIRLVIPLRIRLSGFKLSKSQLRILRRNADTSVSTGPVVINEQIEDLFVRHKRRFERNPPDSIYTFLARKPDEEPCEVRQLSVHLDDELIAVSFFDVGAESCSSIYAMFEPDQARRGLGIFTMLKEIEFAAAEGKEFYYQGYCYSGNSFYDYKKRFFGTEAYLWNGLWVPFARESQNRER